MRCRLDLSYLACDDIHSYSIRVCSAAEFISKLPSHRIQSTCCACVGYFWASMVASLYSAMLSCSLA